MSQEGSGEALLGRARRAIPGGIPGFHQIFPEADPIFVTHGSGAILYDTSGRDYLDLVLGKGPVILGHADPEVTRAVCDAQSKSSMLGLMSPVAVEAAELLLQDFPADWRIRFHKSGSEACAAAVRMARAETGRPIILSCGYHGWHDWCSPSAPGVVESACFFDFGYDLVRLEGLLSEYGDLVAAVIVEPQPGFLSQHFYEIAATMARRAGALFLLDEVKSAFRVPGNYVAMTISEMPDLVMLGKAIANGSCVSCTAGPQALMALSDQLHVGTTFDYECAPLAAICATVPRLREQSIASLLCQRAQELVARLNDLLQTTGFPARAFATGAGWRMGFADPSQERQFYQAMWKRRVLLYPFDNQFLATSHGDDEIHRLIDAFAASLAECALAGSPFGWRDVERRNLNEFPSRKGFLASAPGPTGYAAKDLHNLSEPEVL